MLKLLVCDDEELIREGLAALDWKDYNIECVGKAKNGEDALNKVAELLPDIVLTDVRMPKKDGVYLAQQIYENYPDIKIVFLTGYNEFEYAKKAIDYNVSKYLSKPIDEDELFESICEIRDDILLKKSINKKSESFSKLMQKSRYFLKDYLFNLSSENISSDMLFPISDDASFFIPCVITINTENDERNGTLFMLLEEIDKILSQSEDIKFIPFFDVERLLFIFFVNTENICCAENIVFSECEKIRGILKNYSFDYNIGIGSIVSSVEELSDSYSEAITALSYNKTLGWNHIIYINDVEPKAKISGYYSRIFTAYINAIKTCNEPEASKNINNLFAAMERADDSLYNRQRLCLNLILEISAALYEIDCNPAILFNKTDVWSIIRKTKSARELELFTKNITSVIISHIETLQTQRTENLIEKVKILVDTSFADDASLENIAAQVYMSPCYLSVIFKKETGITFKNYLIQKRIEKSKELLANTNMKIYEIAEKVGYADTRYFSELFQRSTGKTPSQFRNKPEN